MSFEPIPEISANARVPQSTKIWAYSKICDGVQIGENSIIGRSVYVGPGVRIGDNCKVQNGALLYEPANLGNGVFVGPGVILTNDLNPRAVTPYFKIKTQADWVKQGVTIDDGASIGAGSVCVSPVKIGKWAMIGAGSIVIRDVPDFAMVVGNPAVQIGWVGRSGFKLRQIEINDYICDQTEEKYFLNNGVMVIAKSDM